ncbi:nickel-dependent hydrogenase large subunit [Methylocystis bryophila]|nr:nickel-dependent hydrogenase large subunit [Methylocystis bryophila]BDV37238.1 hydrogenase expression protein HypE [Methylocystis bryophila]
MVGMLQKEKLASSAFPIPSRPWPREVVGAAGWKRTIEEIASGASDMLSLWSDGAWVYLGVFEKDTVRIVSFDCGAEKSYPAVGYLHPPAIRLEKAIRDLFGLEAEGATDRRRWLDHGRWGLRHPGAGPETAEAGGDPYTFLPVEGGPLHQIPVGPVHAGIIEPGHFRFSANGEVVVRLEERLGFVHKGIDQLLQGAPIDHAAKIAARVSGDSTVAYGLAFAQAVEAALEIEVPERATHLRALMAELERLANHFGDIGGICNDAAFSLMLAHCGVIREEILRASAECFGHRLMMDRVVPGGVMADLTAAGIAALRALVERIESRLQRLIAVYGDTTSLQDRTVATGVLDPRLAAQFACGGFIGRASGRTFDARKAIGYAPYPSLSFDVGSATGGDVDARVWVRFDEVKASLQILKQVLDRLPNGELATKVDASRAEVCEGASLVEGFRGDVLAWLRIEKGVIRCAHLRDPSWFQWPLLEAAIKGNIVADFPLCNKSFNCSYSGHDR